MGLLQSEHLTKLQLLNCCIAEKTESLEKDLSYGLKSKNCKLERLEILQGLFRVLVCYDGLTGNEEVLASTTITGGAWSSGCARIEVNGIDITDGWVCFDSSLANPYTAIVEAINNHSSIPDYTAELTGDREITLTAEDGSGSTPNGYLVEIFGDADSDLLATANNLSGGVDGDPTPVNCLTEEQVLDLWEYIDQYCCVE